MEILIVIIFVVAFIVIAVLGAQQAKQRRTELGQWAAGRGLSFRPESNSSMDDRYPHFSCLREGSNRYAYNIMRGGWKNYSVCAFDYHYETSSTDSKGHTKTTSHYFSAVVLETGLALKPLSIRGETFFDKIGEFLGFDDIDFESAEFSRRFRVTSPDRRWAFDVLHQEAMEFLLHSPRFSIDFHDGCAIAKNGRVFKPGDFDVALGVLDGLLGRIPQGVLDELKGVDA